MPTPVLSPPLHTACHANGLKHFQNKNFMPLLCCLEALRGMQSRFILEIQNYGVFQQVIFVLASSVAPYSS